MLIECGPRCNGKTYRLLKYAKENNAVVVCSMPKAMEEKAREYGLGKIECISYSAFLDVHIKVKDISFVIDEISNFLSHFNNNIIGFTQGVENLNEN